MVAKEMYQQMYQQQFWTLADAARLN